MEEFKEKKKSLSEKLGDISWKRRFQKRGAGFYMFMSEFCRYSRGLAVVKESITWGDIPGYGVLLKTFLVEFSNKTIREYPDSMIESTKHLLYN